MKKKCKICQKNKDESKFYNSSTASDGKQVYCKVCQNEYSRKHRQDNIEYTLERERLYRESHKEDIANYQKEYYSRPEIIEKTKRYHKKYQKKNKERLREYMQSWVSKNKEHINKKALEYYYKNKESILAKRKEKRQKEKGRT